MSGARGRLQDVVLRLRGPRPPRLRRRPIGLRRLLSAGLAAGATAVALHLLAPAPPDQVPVLVAAHDVGAGRQLTADDLRVARWAAPTRPGAALTDASAALGRVTAGPLGRGRPVTESDLLGPGLLTGQPADLVAVPVRLAEPAAGTLLRRGDRVDVIAAASGSPVVSAAVVLARPAGLQESWTGSSDGAVVVLGVPLEQAAELARAQAAGALAVAVRPG